MLRVGTSFFGKHRSIWNPQGWRSKALSFARSTNGRMSWQLLQQEHYQILQQSKLPSTLTEETNKGRFGRFFDFGEYAFDVQKPNLNLESCPGRFG